ncbi:hypothetical protein [Tautonia plasticadhaerens]|uniref:hypothetical protein n=1 Tax=Tautonia plasticadhaerens TaxID=2527974 RepID=UPI0011A2CF7B|nr:hypothetical protein [Tautonia plasticadhaerens]
MGDVAEQVAREEARSNVWPISWAMAVIRSIRPAGRSEASRHDGSANQREPRVLLWADAAELDRLRRLRAYRRTWTDETYPKELTTPR